MQRRDFFKLTGCAVLALPEMNPRLLGADEGRRSESSPWIHGSPFLGHADMRSHFRGLAADQIAREIVHFRTAEPWRKRILFGL